jgi:hypothetical protein
MWHFVGFMDWKSAILKQFRAEQRLYSANTTQYWMIIRRTQDKNHIFGWQSVTIWFAAILTIHVMGFMAPKGVSN